MNILVFALLSDKKLISKLEPLIRNSNVDKIFLVRRIPLYADKIINITPPSFLKKNLVLNELYRILQGFYLCIFYKIDLLMGIYFENHGLYASVLGKIFRKPYINQIIGNDIHRVSDNYLFKRLLLSSAAIITRGDNTKKIVHNLGYPNEYIFCPANVFEFVDFKRKNHWEIEKKYDLIYIGNFERYKRIDFFLNVVSIIKFKHKQPALKVVLMGEGSLKNEMKDLAIKLNISENVKFEGYKREIYSYLEQAKVFLLTSESEGLPMVIVEAMHAGLPCVASDDADMSTIISNGTNGFVVPIGDLNQFAAHCNTLLTDSTQYQRMSKNAADTIESKREEYSLPYITREWERILNRVAARGN